MSGLEMQQPAERSGGFRVLAIAAAGAGLLLLAAAAFVLSYAGVHAVALSAGVPPQTARLYPVIFDAMLVITGAAVLSLRRAGLPSRCYAWLVLLAAVAGADALYATGTPVPHRAAAVAAAVIPWALLLIGLSLLLAMLRYSRLHRAGLTFAQEPPLRRGGLAALGFPPQPPAVPAASGAGPGPGAVAAAMTGHPAEPEPFPAGDPLATAEAGNGQLATAERDAAAGPGKATTAEPEPPAEPAADPGPGAAPFGRVRSSPVQPEA